MTREEQIAQASIEYTMQRNPMCLGGDNFSDQVQMMNRNYAFEDGAKWADEHPINVWHDGTPCEQYDPESYLYYDRCNNLIPEIYNFRKHGNYRWAYINDPLPKGDEK